MGYINILLFTLGFIYALGKYFLHSFQNQKITDKPLFGLNNYRNKCLA